MRCTRPFPPGRPQKLHAMRITLLPILVSRAIFGCGKNNNKLGPSVGISEETSEK